MKNIINVCFRIHISQHWYRDDVFLLNRYLAFRIGSTVLSWLNAHFSGLCSRDGDFTILTHFSCYKDSNEIDILIARQSNIFWMTFSYHYGLIFPEKLFRILSKQSVILRSIIISNLLLTFMKSSNWAYCYSRIKILSNNCNTILMKFSETSIHDGLKVLKQGFVNRQNVSTNSIINSNCEKTIYLHFLLGHHKFCTIQYCQHCKPLG